MSARVLHESERKVLRFRDCREDYEKLQVYNCRSVSDSGYYFFYELILSVSLCFFMSGG